MRMMEAAKLTDVKKGDNMGLFRAFLCDEKGHLIVTTFKEIWEGDFIDVETGSKHSALMISRDLEVATYAVMMPSEDITGVLKELFLNGSINLIEYRTQTNFRLCTPDGSYREYDLGR